MKYVKYITVWKNTIIAIHSCTLCSSAMSNVRWKTITAYRHKDKGALCILKKV